VGAFDVGQIAVLEDQGDLALLRNPIDLAGAALRFTPSGSGYSVTRLTLPLEPDTGTRLSLGDDDSTRITLPFGFPFFGQTFSAAFVNSDGNVTFGQKDDASTSRDVGRLVNGPPRVAPLLVDLNPETGGTISLLSVADHATVTWRAVPQFDETDKNTFQVTLWADGRVDFVFDTELATTIEQAATGIAPGNGAGGLTAVDFAHAAAVTGTGALVESFRDRDGLDTIAVARKFYATHPDDINQRFLGEDSALTVLAHEVGHRWLVNARFRDGATTSTELLGRDEVHWSFFVDTDGSYLEGNDITPEADGRFRTTGASLRYSAMDQYLMGMRDASEVAPFFFVRSPTGTDTDPGQNPASGVAFGGTRKDVTVADVVAAIGDRNPRGAPWARPFREAFVYVTVGAPADPGNIAKVERIRAAWPAFFAQSVEGRGSVDPSLN
jgi:hypothetical protein